MSSEKNIALREHFNETGSVLAVADHELLGQTLKDGIVTFIVSKHFYFEKRVDEEELKEALQEAGNINLIGVRAHQVAVKLGIVTETGVRRIAGIPHAQIYKL